LTLEDKRWVRESGLAPSSSLSNRKAKREGGNEEETSLDLSSSLPFPLARLKTHFSSLASQTLRYQPNKSTTTNKTNKIQLCFFIEMATL